MSDLTEQIIQAWQTLQEKKPLIQCITNKVASNYVANVLLACGASPAMIDNPFETQSFTQISDALNINLGTPTTEQMQAIQLSAQTAHEHNIPWILDPVGYSDILKWRSKTTDNLLKFKPTVIRGNASEISALAGGETQPKGVDSTLESHYAYQQAKKLLGLSQCIAISGESDFILSEEDVVQVFGGSYLQPKVTATGCALGALVAAYCAVTTPFIATVSAHVHFAIAGQLAFKQTQTPGSFSIAFMDQLFSLTPELIEQNIQIKYL